MKDEYGYIDIKPFEKLDKSDQKPAIINERDNKLELKINDIEKFNVLDFYDNKFGELTQSREIYGIDSKYRPLTLYRCNIVNSTFRALPHSIITSEMYVIGNEGLSKIAHFTDKTKIRKMNYYHNNIGQLFFNNSVILKTKKNKLEVCAKNQKKISISKFVDNDNTITINLINHYTYSYTLTDVNIRKKSYFEVNFSKSINLDDALLISNRIDCIIHMFLLTNTVSKGLTFYSTLGHSYEFYNMKHKENDDKKCTFYLDKAENAIDNFDKLFRLFMSVPKGPENNALFPFLHFNRKVPSLEIEFLEFYKVLEFIDTSNRQKQGKGKNSNFLIQLLKKYPNVKQTYFGTQKNNEIEEEIRSLRNYYSHNGYYIEQLPIPTDKPKRYKKIDVQWLYDVKNFVKLVAYLEIYSFANISVDETKLMHNLH